MKSAVVVFPASNCDRDAATALEQLTGGKAHAVGKLMRAQGASILVAFSVLTSAALAEGAAKPVPAPAKTACLINGAPVDPATLAAALDLQKATGSQERVENIIDLMMPSVLNMIKQATRRYRRRRWTLSEMLSALR